MAPLPTPPPGARTSIKKAKADFKARNYNPLNDRQKKQLERQVELDRRAWRARETEKRKAEAAKKREEKARLEREESKRMMLATQRRCDRFGYKSSQMHLGAFFGQPAVVEREEKIISEGEEFEIVDFEGEEDLLVEEVEEAHAPATTAPPKPKEDSFGDGDIDDEALLDALGLVEEIKQSAAQQSSRPDETLRQPAIIPAPIVTPDRTPTQVDIVDDMDSFWDQLDSSTQISRELNEPPCRSPLNSKPEPQPESKPQVQLASNLGCKPDPKAQTQRSLTRDSSFGSDDFDISIEEIEESLLQAEKSAVKVSTDRQLMPPPSILPARRTPLAQSQPKTQMTNLAKVTPHSFKNAAPKSTPSLQKSPTLTMSTSLKARDFPTTSKHGSLGNAGFTLSELESFLDDDLQLTQVAAV